MTPTQALAVGAIGGIASSASLALVVVLALLASDVPENIRARREQRRARRKDLASCRAIDALPPIHRGER
ncbi:hypothetical protein ACIQVK_25365 [Streptomyces sp. NPDC090493]|uniref:hypothetical protein n=1 Tax=Streptomyces sp. NPDC090493 TaxID=3365964 RepID=UPI0037F70B06